MPKTETTKKNTTKTKKTTKAVKKAKETKPTKVENNEPETKLTYKGECAVECFKNKKVAKGAEKYQTYFDLLVWPEKPVLDKIEDTPQNFDIFGQPMLVKDLD